MAEEIKEISLDIPEGAYKYLPEISNWHIKVSNRDYQLVP